MTHLPPSGFIGSMATGRGTRASRFSSACAHCFSHGVIHFSCAFAYYYPRNANHIFRREIFRFRAAFAVSPLALSRSLAVSVFKEHRRSFRSPSQALASLATLHVFQCKRITPTPANTPISSGTHPLNNSKCAEMRRNGASFTARTEKRNSPYKDIRARHEHERTAANMETERTPRNIIATRTANAGNGERERNERGEHLTRTAERTRNERTPRKRTAQGPPRAAHERSPNRRHFARGSKCDANAPSVGASGMECVWLRLT